VPIQDQRPKQDIGLVDLGKGKIKMVRAYQFIQESMDAVNELDLYINNNEDLYRKKFMPLVHNLNRDLKANRYNHDNAVKQWNLMVNDAAREYVKEFGKPGEDVKDMFAQDSRAKVAQVLADRELENMKAGEYDVAKGTI
jgi:hypothetical protein